MSPSSHILALTLAFAASALSAVPGKIFGSEDSVGSGRLMDQLVGSNIHVGNCLAYYAINDRDTCVSIVDLHPGTLTLNELYTWNPQVTGDCSNLIPGQSLCIRAGTAQDCGACSAFNKCAM